MAWIILFIGIICSALLTNIFKLFEKFNVTTPVAIVFNYITASTLSFIFANELPNFSKLMNYPWVWAAIFLGFLFVSLFNLMAIISQKIGITQANVANKTTFIFPAIMGMFFYSENINAVKIIGFLVALIAVWYTAREKGKPAMEKHSNFLLILVLFVGGGMIDIVLSIANHDLSLKGHEPLFTAYAFGVAGISGSIYLIYNLMLKKIVVQKKDIIGGLALGVPNFFSIFMFLSALTYQGMESSVVFTVANLGIIVVATLMGAWFFKEKITKDKFISIAFAILSILLVSMSDFEF